MLDTFEQRLPHLGAEQLWPLIADRADARDGNTFLIGWSDLGRPRRSVAASLREPDQLDPQHLNHWLDRMTRSVNVPHVAPHQLRHSCATNLLRAGVPLPIASNLLNHANVHTTMRYMKAGGDELGEWLTSTTPPEGRHLPRGPHVHSHGCCLSKSADAFLISRPFFFRPKIRGKQPGGCLVEKALTGRVGASDSDVYDGRPLRVLNGGYVELE